jgi:hypothetical protein
MLQRNIGAKKLFQSAALRKSGPGCREALHIAGGASVALHNSLQVIE